jgi:hypothetical protein
MHRERDHKVAISPCTEWGTAAAACTLGGRAFERGRALPEGHPLVLKLSGGIAGHHANHGQATLGKLGSFRLDLSAEVDGEAPADRRTDRSQIGSGAQVMGIRPAREMGCGVCQLAQQIATDHASLMPQITGHVVAEPGSGADLAHCSDKIEPRAAHGCQLSRHPNASACNSRLPRSSRHHLPVGR